MNIYFDNELFYLFLQDQASSLWIASQEGHLPVVKELLAARATVDLARQDGGTALFKAAHKGHYDIVVELIGHGASQELLAVS